MKKTAVYSLVGAALFGTMLAVAPNSVQAASKTTVSQKAAQSKKATTTVANVEIKGKKTIHIQAGTPVYRTPDSKTPTSKTLKAGSSYRSYGSLDNGYLWYHLGGNQWIIANVANGSMKDPSASSKTPAKTTTKAVTKTTTKQSSTPVNTVSKKHGKLVIKAATTVYSQPSVTSAVKKTLNPGGSFVTYETVNNGYVWYNLGGSQWVIASVANGSMQDPAVKTSSSALTEVRSYHGVATISYVPGKGLSAYTSPVSGKKVSGLKLTTGSKWRVYGQAKANGERWFNLGGSQWIQARYTNFKATK